MRDYRFVSFFLGHKHGEEARRLLMSCDPFYTAIKDRANRNAWMGDLHYGVHLRLPIEDQRLVILLDKLRRKGDDPFVRIDREYSATDLDQAEWLILRVATAGLYGGVDYDQEYVRGEGCKTCGAGATPIPPLVAELGKMGKKDLDHLVYEGHLIASARVARQLGELTGVEAASVRSPRRPADALFQWLKITGSFSKLHASTTGIKAKDVCPTCGRSGHYACFEHPEAPVVEGAPRAVHDFNLSWEYFGDWRQVRNRSNDRRVGGSRSIVVSQRVRQVLADLKVRRLNWVPVTIAK